MGEQSLAAWTHYDDVPDGAIEVLDGEDSFDLNGIRFVLVDGEWWCKTLTTGPRGGMRCITGNYWQVTDKSLRWALDTLTATALLKST